MRRLSVCLALLFITPVAFAQMTSGPVVKDGDVFPFVVDFNGDGLDDLIQNQQVLINDGSSFSKHDLGIPATERVIGVLDVNGDGIPDLITDNLTGIPGPHSARLYIADASRHYGNGIIVANNAPQPLIADVDGDGKDDLLLLTGIYKGAAPLGYDVDVMRSRGDGTFDHLQTFRIAGFPQYRSPRVPAADLNHDGLPDLVLRLPYELVILHGTGGGQFAVERRFTPTALNTWGFWDMHVADIDGDGNADIVLPGVRMIRVLFGDGHGNFPRLATAAIPQVHDLTGLPAFMWHIVTPDLQQPRDFAVGHFTRSDRDEIAAGMAEGDIVVLAYDQGALTEVWRTRTEFFFLDIRSGNFRGTGLTDIYSVGVMQYQLSMPPPHIFYGTATTPAIVSRPVGRHRAAGRPPVTDTVLNVHVQNACAGDDSTRIVLKRDGEFGHADGVDAVFDDGTLYLRITPPFVDPDYPMMPTLAPVGGVYSGTYGAALLDKTCTAMTTVTATVE
ncbi:MAG TPA: VCBS repeat-containing protein [Thermoanaerobaculia bacterium]|nr:VCBS repeat-containing protein [Thermoanaerobaculia bacterium]